MRIRRRATLPEPPEPGTVLAGAAAVGLRYGSRPVLEDVHVDVVAGEVLALVGPNGAGKSTLLSVLAGDRAPDSGAVTVHGRPVGEWSAADLARRRAVLPQHHLLSFPFPVVDVVRMGRAPWAGTPAEAEDDARVAAALEATGVSDFVERPFLSLSGGERARVALARVLAQHTALVLLDEPTAALDLRHQELVLRVARDRAAAGAAVLVVLHDLGLAAAHADRVAVLDSGRVVADGAPAEVFTAELLSTVYGHAVEVFPHPRTGTPLVLPVR
ncbi:hemin import ATP-binding protein HmuV [Virgisporangium aliadipatigenens]|uniref:Hemin import ATP-binding protein HmuV n=1 Tax=Virgisporangium aliadipatigenens TaxID=741659 RepID=A0A8J3YRC4_9ACTN|nr:heme ABC transporter ATP-binding protein [Virgisporangium aliadipatigenens]GIJ48963.1 hemin import ATP-binding protein HmuV [Virgisporangium aliadipatigenens]